MDDGQGDAPGSQILAAFLCVIVQAGDVDDVVDGLVGGAERQKEVSQGRDFLRAAVAEGRADAGEGAERHAGFQPVRYANVFLDNRDPGIGEVKQHRRGDAQPEIQSLSDMRDPQQIDILLVDGSLPAIGQPGVLDQELNLEIRQRAAVDRAWRAVDEVAGRAAAPEFGAVFHVVHDQRSRMQDFRKCQPVLQPLEIAAHDLAADSQRVSAPALAAPVQYVDQGALQILDGGNDGWWNAEGTCLGVAQQAG